VRAFLSASMRRLRPIEAQQAIGAVQPTHSGASTMSGRNCSGFRATARANRTRNDWNGSMIAVLQSSVPRPRDFFFSYGWETTIAGYSISVSGLR
jgi:hypothetical protein